MVFDEATAARAVAALAATTDAELTTDIRAAVEAVGVAWGAFRADPAYPAKDHPARTLVDERGTAVAAALEKTRAVSPAPDLAAAVKAASLVLSLYWPDRRAAEQPLSAAVERLRYLAMSRTALVRDARKVAGSAPNEA